MDAKKEWAMIDGMMNGVFDEDNWKTINGTHVLIGEGGEIKGGPEALRNYKKGEKSSKKSDGKTTSSFSRKDGESYRDFMNRSAKEANSMITAGKSEGAMGPKDIDAALSKGGEKELADSLDNLPVGSKVSFSGEDTFGEFETYAVKWDSDRWYAISKYTSGNEKGEWFNETKTSPGSNIAYWANRSQEDKPKGSNKEIEFDHPEGADKVKGYVGNERVAELAEKALKKKGDEGLHPGYELDRIESITVFPPDEDYKTDGNQLIVTYSATNKKTGKTEQFESHPYVKAYSGSKSASKSTKEGTTNKDLFTSLAPDQLDRNLKKVLPVGATLTNKETGEEWYVAKHFGDNGVGRERNSVYMVRSELKENGQKNITQSKGLRYFPSQLKKDFTVDTSAEEMEIVMDMMAGDWDPDQPRDENGRWSDTGASDYDDDDYDDDDGDEVTGRLEEFQNGWWGRRNELEDDLEAAGFSVDDANDEYISVSIEDDDEDRSFALYLGGTPSTITINSIKEF